MNEDLQYRERRPAKLIWGSMVLIVALAAYFLAVPFAAGYLNDKGIALMRNGNTTEARKAFERSLKLPIKNPVAHAGLGHIALGEVMRQYGTKPSYSNADFPSAIKHYEKALAQNIETKNPAENANVLQNLAFSYWSQKEYDRALSLYLKKIGQYPNSSFWARYFVALDYTERLNKPDEAMAILVPALESALLDNDSLYLFHALLARLSLYRASYEEAAAYAYAALNSAGSRAITDEATEAAHLALIQVYGARGELALVEREYATTKNKFGGKGNTEGYDCILAKAYFESGVSTKARTIAEQVNKATSGSLYGTCLHILGRIALIEEKNVGAAQYFREYITFTDPIERKNIFIQRIRQELSDKLRSL